MQMPILTFILGHKNVEFAKAVAGQSLCDEELVCTNKRGWDVASKYPQPTFRIGLS